MITKATPFSKLSLFRSTCAAILSASPAKMPTLGLKEEWDAPNRTQPTVRTGPLVALGLGALTLCFALSAAAQPPWGGGGSTRSPFKSAPDTDLVCNLSDPQSNIEITTQPSAAVPFSEFFAASLNISGLMVCREFSRETGALAAGPGLFRLNQLTAFVEDEEITKGFDFKEICNSFSGRVCVDLTRTWTVKAEYDLLGNLVTQARYELVAVDEAARSFCRQPPSDGEACKVFYGLEDPLTSQSAPRDGDVVIRVESRTITAPTAEETPDPRVDWGLCHTQKAERVSGGTLFAGTDNEEFSSSFGSTGPDRLYRATTSGPFVVPGSSTILSTDYPINGLGEGSGFLFAGQPRDVPLNTDDFPGNILRGIDFSGNILGSVAAAIPRDCCNEEMVLFGGDLYHAHFSDGIRKLDPDDGSEIQFFPQPEVVGMAVIDNQIWITKWNGRRVGIWDPATNTFTPKFSTAGFSSNAGALAWDPVGRVLWLGLQGGRVIPVDPFEIVDPTDTPTPLGDPDPILPFGSIPNTIDGLAFLSDVGNLPIDCEVEVVPGVPQSAVVESNIEAQRQSLIEVVGRVHLDDDDDHHRFLRLVVVPGCGADPFKFDPNTSTVVPEVAFVNGNKERPIRVLGSLALDVISDESCDIDGPNKDLILGLHGRQFTRAFEATNPPCKKRGQVPLDISFGNDMDGFLGGTDEVVRYTCDD